MSGTDSIKGLIALSINIDFGKQSKAEGQIKRLEKHGFELLTDSKVEIEGSKYNLKDIVFLDGFSYFIIYINSKIRRVIPFFESIRKIANRGQHLL